MPKKIIEREIVDDDLSLDGSEHDIEDTEVEPKNVIKPKNFTRLGENKQVKIKEPKSKSKKEKSLEELVAIELNKRNRTANATKAKVERYDQNLIEKKVQERLQEVERKKNEKKQFESMVEQTVARFLSQSQPQQQYQEEPKPRRQSKPKPKAKAPPKQKAVRQPKQEQQEQPQYYPSNAYSYPDYNNANSLRTLFM